MSAPDTGARRTWAARGRARWAARGRDAGAAAAAGALLFASFPPRTLWWLAPLGVALLVLVLTRWGRGGVGVPAGFGYGTLAGLGFFTPLLPWVGVYVGALPWLALAATCALYTGLFGAGVALLSRLRPRWLLPVTAAAWWSLSEWLRSVFPFGGFPWGRLAFGQPEGPLLALAALGGAPLLSFGVALAGAGLAVLATSARTASARPASAPPRAWTTPAAGALAAVLPFVVAAAAPGPPPPTGTVTVAAVQGSVPRLGLEFNAQRRAVLDNHAARTRELAAAVAAGRAPQPDIVVWPENSSDIDPYRNPDAAMVIDRAAAEIGAPILVGAVLANGDGTGSNSVLVWQAGRGPVDRHDKTIIQPFGEYLPLRGFFRLFSPYADRAGRFVPGDSDWVVDAAGVPVGVSTCYEVAFDRAARTAVASGAQFLTVPTNNATFGDTEMTYQQLAMSRVRAVEHGRAVVVAATSGVSAIVDADGRVAEQSPLFAPAVLTSEIALRQGLTPATRLGAWPERLLTALALVAGAVAYVTAAGTRRRAARAGGLHSTHKP